MPDDPDPHLISPDPELKDPPADKTWLEVENVRSDSPYDGDK